MDDYISRDMAIARLTKVEVTKKLATMADAKREIAEMPAADVAPVVHGHWVPIGEREFFRFYGAFDVPQSETKMEYSCSTDGCWAQTTNRFPFCPMCGAKMDGGDEANENRKSDRDT